MSRIRATTRKYSFSSRDYGFEERPISSPLVPDEPEELKIATSRSLLAIHEKATLRD
jgi:hypothetical protein